MTAEMGSEIEVVVNEQLEFYRKGKAGCLFAAHAALNPDRFGWRFSIVKPEREQIEETVQSAIDLEGVSTQSLVFPEVTTVPDLKNFLAVLGQTNCCILGQQEIFEDSICLGYRMQAGELTSWVTGFGNFDFLPNTRHAPYTEKSPFAVNLAQIINM